MDAIKYKDWTLSTDKSATIMVYEEINKGGANECTCVDCKNFVQQREQVFPNEVKLLLNDLGIDYEKEFEVVHYAKINNGLHHYGGWFHFIGDFTGPSCYTYHDEQTMIINLMPITENFSMGFSEPDAPSFFDNETKLVQVNFEVLTPWVIDAVESM